MEDVIVKVKKSDLERLIDANVKAYNLLDEITNSSVEVGEMVNKAFGTLEEAPSEINDIIIEEETSDDPN